MRIFRLSAAALLLASMPPSHAASSISPAEPASFDVVNLRMAVDDCSFDASSVRVSMSSNVVKVVQQVRNCLVAGTPIVADVRLGAFPVGLYRAEVYASPTALVPVESLVFEVRGRPEILIFPPPPHPLADYTGIWYDPDESGWGVSFHQAPDNVTFAMLFVYTTASQPEWYSIQGGRWTSSTLWMGTVYKTTGPALASSIFDPRLVNYTVAGTASFDFTQAPGREGMARFSYTVAGVTASKPVTRIPL
jgi:hypothetical protein